MLGAGGQGRKCHACPRTKVLPMSPVVHSSTFPHLLGRGITRQELSSEAGVDQDTGTQFASVLVIWLVAPKPLSHSVLGMFPVSEVQRPIPVTIRSIPLLVPSKLPLVCPGPRRTERFKGRPMGTNGVGLDSDSAPRNTRLTLPETTVAPRSTARSLTAASWH